MLIGSNRSNQPTQIHEMFALRQATRPLARQASRLNPASSHLLSTNANAKSKSKEEEELINMFQTMPNEHLGNSYDLNWTLCAIDIFNSGSLNYKINSPRNLFAISEDMKKKFESMDHKVPAGLDAGKEPMAGADMSFDDYEELYEVATEFMSDDEVTKVSANFHNPFVALPQLANLTPTPKTKKST